MNASSGLASSMQATLAAAVDMGRTRLDLACIELDEERLRLARQFLCAAGALFFAGLGLVLASLLIVMLAGAANRLLALGLLTALHLGVGLTLSLIWLRLSRSKPVLLSATRSALQQDVASLRNLRKDPP